MEPEPSEEDDLTEFAQRSRLESSPREMSFAAEAWLVTQNQIFIRAFTVPQGFAIKTWLSPLVQNSCRLDSKIGQLLILSRPFELCILRGYISLMGRACNAIPHRKQVKLPSCCERRVERIADGKKRDPDGLGPQPCIHLPSLPCWGCRLGIIRALTVRH